MAVFRPLVNWQFPSNIRKLVGIVQKSEKNEKSYLFFNFEIPDVNSLE